MNKNKISPFLLNNISTLDLNSKHVVFVFSQNFDQTKQVLKECGFSFKPYRFAKCFSVPADIDDIAILSNFDCINYIHHNPIVQMAQKDFSILNLQNLNENKHFGQSQTICFIDTGIYPHFDFVFPKSRIIKFVDFVNNQEKPYDDNGHGTFVAGIACGNGIFSKEYSGIAPLCNIVMLKALCDKGNSNTNTILDAMQWIYENHKVYNISVVCMSFGADIITNNDPLSLGAEALWKRGITIVAAAGNSGPKTNTIKSPGCNQHIITVGALDTNQMNVADFSSRGPTVFGHKPDLVAPAVNLTSCSNKFLPYTIMSGTSVATPIVAGVCAIIKSKYPNMTNVEIKKFLLSNCVPLTGDKDLEGAGFLNFEKLFHF